jgi:hypothetical protein
MQGRGAGRHRDGGYALRWSWTGYPGNNLVGLAPVAAPAAGGPGYPAPGAAQLDYGDAAERAATARQPALKEGKDE